MGGSLSGLNSSSYYDLQGHNFSAIGESHKFRTEDDFGWKFNNWKVQRGSGEVDISIESIESGGTHMVFRFIGKNTTHIFMYNSSAQTMDDSQANGMFFSNTFYSPNKVNFLFLQPKNLTLLGTTELSWAINVKWDSMSQGYPAQVQVGIESILTTTTFSM